MNLIEPNWWRIVGNLHTHNYAYEDHSVWLWKWQAAAAQSRLFNLLATVRV